MLKDTDLDFVLIENTLFSKNKDKTKGFGLVKKIN